MSRFNRYELRTTDTGAARAFYTDLLGPQLWAASDISVVPLPERAAARGAPAHWLGHIAVRDVEGTAARITSSGGQQLGPLQRNADGSSRAILRDPFGAIMAVSSEIEAPPRSSVAFHLMHSRDHEAAFAFYAGVFGWTATEAVDMGPEMGRHQAFAWDESGIRVGSMADTARQPHIHTQWQFFFPVTDIERAVARVRELGGLAFSPTRTWSGDLASACDDPQGAAFGLYQQR